MLFFYTIYNNPRDFPDKFVVRRIAVTANTILPEAKPWWVGNTLEEARKSLPDGLYNLGREPHDEPQIVETWI